MSLAYLNLSSSASSSSCSIASSTFIWISSNAKPTNQPTNFNQIHPDLSPPSGLSSHQIRSGRWLLWSMGKVDSLYRQIVPSRGGGGGKYYTYSGQTGGARSATYTVLHSICLLYSTPLSTQLSILIGTQHTQLAVLQFSSRSSSAAHNNDYYRVQSIQSPESRQTKYYYYVQTTEYSISYYIASARKLMPQSASQHPELGIVRGRGQGQGQGQVQAPEYSSEGLT
ncbi:hypothetical protein BO70DRAFT_423555 [Aspergillus heteromorphus CBS 117.55]|uniref:Uncharacterized protein n=1 Tax=Aspergillus heteromorphus CBS 117.55 TaxID=1448321 RepID=A0A317WKM0_9EURO|nr:uncharacterized protein BO70DRAFT_423555 [Aspergillus heteromorphus CBS 117.55]PWY86251.1 hypothetical protein BO70DRAFT_423555 [Aspergillus heteromorphus CBS 117.55]